MKGLSRPLRRLSTTVADADKLDPCDRLQPWNVSDPSIIPRSNDANLNGLCIHTVPPLPADVSIKMYGLSPRFDQALAERMISR
jgi:hypothetical protein